MYCLSTVLFQKFSSPLSRFLSFLMHRDDATFAWLETGKLVRHIWWFRSYKRLMYKEILTKSKTFFDLVMVRCPQTIILRRGPNILSTAACISRGHSSDSGTTNLPRISRLGVQLDKECCTAGRYSFCHEEHWFHTKKWWVLLFFVIRQVVRYSATNSIHKNFQVLTRLFLTFSTQANILFLDFKFDIRKRYTNIRNK
jgi:hypothetical protein